MRCDSCIPRINYRALIPILNRLHAGWGIWQIHAVCIDDRIPFALVEVVDCPHNCTCPSASAWLSGLFLT
jgi:hypothetical protein